MKVFGTDTLDVNYIEDHKKYTEKILEISNDIIVYNLIEKEGKEKKRMKKEKFIDWIKFSYFSFLTWNSFIFRFLS